MLKIIIAAIALFTMTAANAEPYFGVNTSNKGENSNVLLGVENVVSIFGVEAGYHFNGDMGDHYSLAAVARVPLGHGFFSNTKLGKVSSGYTWLVGTGLEYDFDQHMAVRLDGVQYYDGNNDPVSLATFGFGLRF